MGFAQLQHWVRAQILHDKARVSTERPADLLRPDVNIVHIRHSSPVNPKLLQREAQQLGVGFCARVRAQTDTPRPAAAALTRQLGKAEVREWLQADISDLIGVFGEQLGAAEVAAKLEVLGSTPCPRFHADHVGVRLLVTYYGPGTVYVENRHVRRRWLWGSGGGVAVGYVEATAARQAAAADRLFLKGHSAPGNLGMGAVHRSPDLQLDCPASSLHSDADGPGRGLRAGGDVCSLGPPLRLLLTVDDAVGVAAAEGSGGDLPSYHHHCRGQRGGVADRVG